MPGRFKDYVAMPKFNMYQSLHTTVIGPSGAPLEIQIRSEEMHRTAEYGVAAHWRYKEGTRGEDSFDERLAWLRQMLEWQTELKDPREFMEALKIDLFEEEVFVFSPKGDVISLKRGSTPIDFAYAIHTEVGNHCVGAKVNGAIVPLGYELQMGDRVEVLTNKKASPSRDWLNIVRTSSAKSKIRNYFSKVTREDDLIRGRDELSKVMRKHGLGIGSKTAEKAIATVSHEMNYAHADDVIAAIGAGKVSAKQVGTKLLKLMAKEGETAKPEPHHEEFTLDKPMTAPRAKRRRTAGGVKVKGLDDALVRLASCCHPVPGDDIIGFVTRGRGVSVHRRDCPNARDLLSTPERIINVEWDLAQVATFQIEIFVEAMDRLRLLQDVTSSLAEQGVNIIASSTTTHRDGLVDMRFLFELGDLSRLDQVLREMRSVDGVFEARRMMPGEATQKKKGDH
jgi:GTP diphosphokinase / guanosine-3',5'-bis(diphosphate) 3'-diphosphatase